MRYVQLPFSNEQGGQTQITITNKNVAFSSSMKSGQQSISDFITSAQSSNRGPTITTPKGSGQMRESVFLNMDEGLSDRPPTPASSAKTPLMAHVACKRETEEIEDDFYDSPRKSQCVRRSDIAASSSQQQDASQTESGRSRSGKLQLRRKEPSTARPHTTDSESLGSQSPVQSEAPAREPLQPSSHRRLTEPNRTPNGACFPPLSFDFLSPAPPNADPSTVAIAADSDTSPSSSPILGPARHSRPGAAPPGHARLPGIREEDCARRRPADRSGDEEEPAGEARAPAGRRRVRRSVASSSDDEGHPDTPSGSGGGDRGLGAAAGRTPRACARGRGDRARPSAQPAAIEIDLEGTSDEEGAGGRAGADGASGGRPLNADGGAAELVCAEADRALGDVGGAGGAGCRRAGGGLPMQGEVPAPPPLPTPAHRSSPALCVSQKIRAVSRRSRFGPSGMRRKCEHAKH